MPHRDRWEKGEGGIFAQRWRILVTPYPPLPNFQNLNIKLDEGGTYYIKAFSFIMATDATAGTRFPRLDFLWSGIRIARVDAPTGTGPSSSVHYSFYEGATFATGGGGTIMAPLPHRLLVPGGTVIKSDIVNFQAGDQIRTPSLYAIFFPEVGEY